MAKFSAERFGHIFSNLAGMAQQYAVHEYLSEPDRQALIFKLNGLVADCGDVGLRVSAKQVNAAIKQLEAHNQWVCAQVSQLLSDLGTALSCEMSEHLFLWIPPEQARYYEQDELFGISVNDAFPSTKKDIRSAGNAYATENWIASVFHSMRVLEVGLNALAQDLGVPCDHTNWHNVIEGIESKIGAFGILPRGSEKANKEKLYSGAAVQFRYFKNAWRNHTMHVREVYDDHDAKSIMDHVGDFMRHIAADIGLKE